MSAPNLGQSQQKKGYGEKFLGETSPVKWDSPKQPLSWKDANDLSTASTLSFVIILIAISP